MDYPTEEELAALQQEDMRELRAAVAQAIREREQGGQQGGQQGQGEPDRRRLKCLVA